MPHRKYISTKAMQYYSCCFHANRKYDLVKRKYASGCSFKDSKGWLYKYYMIFYENTTFMLDDYKQAVIDLTYEIEKKGYLR